MKSWIGKSDVHKDHKCSVENCRALVKAALSDYKEKATLLLLGSGKRQYSEIFSAQPQTHAAAHRQCQNHEGYPRMQAPYVPTQVPRTYPCTTARKTRIRTHNHMHKCQTPAHTSTRTSAKHPHAQEHMISAHPMQTHTSLRI